MRIIRAWIVIRNGVDLRLVKKRPILDPNEVAIEVVVNAPTPPRIVGTVTIELPDPPPATAEAVAIQYPEDTNTEEATS